MSVINSATIQSITCSNNVWSMLRFEPGYYLDARSTGREEANPYESLAQKQLGPCAVAASCSQPALSTHLSRYPSAHPASLRESEP